MVISKDRQILQNSTCQIKKGLIHPPVETYCQASSNLPATRHRQVDAHIYRALVISHEEPPCLLSECQLLWGATTGQVGDCICGYLGLLIDTGCWATWFDPIGLILYSSRQRILKIF